MSGARVVVIGGGLAGITAALDCAEGGAEVTLVEVRRRLGGAAYSFRREGLEMDNGQHVFLRGCLAYRALLARLQSSHLVEIQPRLEIPVLKPGAPRFVLRRNRLPAPLQLAGALARYPHLRPLQRLGAARAALGLMRLERSSATDPGSQLDRSTLGEWLARHGQGPEALAALWDLIALPTLNLPATEASLELGAFVFRAGLLTEADAGDIGFHRGTLSEIIAEPGARALARAGVEVRLGWRAERLQAVAEGFAVTTGRAGTGAEEGVQESEHEAIVGDTVIVALGHARAAALLEDLLGEQARRIGRIGVSPIVNLHVVYDREVTSDSFAAGVGTPVQYLFDRTRAAGAPEGSQYLAVSLSGAEREMGMSVEALRERYLPALDELLAPRARARRWRPSWSRANTPPPSAPRPASAALRPPARTSVPGLALAGSWTATGWPATLEGAVLSGHSAADAALRALGLRGARDGAASAAVGTGAL